MKNLHSFCYYLPAYEAAVNLFLQEVDQPDYDIEAESQAEKFEDFFRQNYRNRYLLYKLNKCRNCER